MTKAAQILICPFRPLIHLLDNSRISYNPADGDLDRIDWFRSLPFFGVHLMCFAPLWVGVSPVAVWTAVVLYFVRMFAITGFNHRYFSHRSFKTSRTFQFIMALLCNACVQRSPIWWAAHHRHHHKFSDQKEDVHSPRQRGFLWSHLLWILSRKNFATQNDLIPDFTVYPELRFLDRFDTLVPIIFAVLIWAFGWVLEAFFPELGTTKWQILVWGFFISTTVLYHSTFTINSFCHIIGKKRYETGDDSKNSLILALTTLGEGWHNNHHYYPHCSRQGFKWWEIDITYYILRALSAIGLVWDIREPPEELKS